MISKALVTGSELREKKKKRFLAIMAKENNKSTACKGAGMARDTENRWEHEGYISQDELTKAYEKYRDYLQSEAHRRAFDGENTTLYQNGKMVRDETGKPVIVKRKDDKLFLLLLKKHVPDFREVGDPLNALEGAGPIVPDGFILFDYRLLYDHERATVLAIAKASKDRVLPMIGHNSPGGAYEALYIDAESDERKTERQSHWYDNYNPPDKTG
jgi:hypothetical protein